VNQSGAAEHIMLMFFERPIVISSIDADESSGLSPLAMVAPSKKSRDELRET
jgi:hypothetical protein